MNGMNRRMLFKEVSRGRGLCGWFLGGRYSQSWRRWIGEAMCFGNRRGYRHWFYATGLPGWLRNRKSFRDCFGYGNFSQQATEEEAEMLKERIKFLQEQIDTMNEYLAKLQKENVEEKRQSN